MGRSMLYRWKIPTIDLPQLGKWSQSGTQRAPVGTAGNKLKSVQNCAIPTNHQSETHLEYNYNTLTFSQELHWKSQSKNSTISPKIINIHEFSQ